MTIARSVADVLNSHVVLEVESIDRMYLNLYVPILQQPAGCAHFWIHHRGYRLASSALMAPMTKSFITRIENFATTEGIDLVSFKKGQRKEELAQQYLARFPAKEGVLFIGKAQEKAPAIRTRRLHNPKTGKTYPDLYKTTALVNQYYFYCVDRDFGPLFVKLSSYFPYNGKVCINGHEYVKRQLEQRGLAYEALDNGVLSCADPAALKRICDGLDEAKIERLTRKWLRRLPHPFTQQDARAGYQHDISILQAEFSLTQVLDRPVTGRVFFEEVIRDNLDMGRPDRVQLVFNRRVMRNTPSRFRTRVITHGVTPSLYIDYKSTTIKQYHKLGRALRTETTINDAGDFGIGKRLKNLPALREVGFTANRRLLSVQRVSHDCAIGEDAFNQVQRPTMVEQQRASGLRFGDPRVMALLSVLVLFRLLPRGFDNSQLRHHLAPLMGLAPEQFSRGQMTYDLRRLRLHGLIERLPRSHRYRVTDFGFRAAAFLQRAHIRLLRAGLAHSTAPEPTALSNAFAHVDRAIDQIWTSGRMAA